MPISGRCLYDRVTINAPDGQAGGKVRTVSSYLVVPVKDPSGGNSQLVIGGLTEDPADAPGPFGVYRLATRTACNVRPLHQATDRSSTLKIGCFLPLAVSMWNCISSTNAAWQTRRLPGMSDFIPRKTRAFIKSQSKSKYWISTKRFDEPSGPRKGLLL